MAKRGRPKRSNPQAERKIYKAELEACLVCNEKLTSVGNTAHSKKTVQTLKGEFHVVAYSRLCDTEGCEKKGHHYHAVGHLQMALPGESYGVDVVAYIGWQRDREQRRFAEIQKKLNEKGVEINERSVGRLYRLYQALMKGGWKKVRERLAETEQKYGGLSLTTDGLKPDGCGGTLYVLYEALGGTPISAMWLEIGDTVRITAWLRQTEAMNFKVLSTMSDREEALVLSLTTVWPKAKHQLCQQHYLGRLSEPIQKADQKLQEKLQSELKGLPKGEKMRGEKKEEQLDAEMGQIQTQEPEQNVSLNPEEKVEPKKEDPQADQSKRHKPLLTNLLFPHQSLKLVDRENGLPISQEAILWDHYCRYYLMAVQDALHRSRRKPFQLGGMAGYDQLVGILNHLEQDNPLYNTKPFFSKLTSRLRQAIETTRDQTEDIRQAQTFLQQVEHFLAHIPRPTLTIAHNPPTEVTARYKVGDIATIEMRNQWQFSFRPIQTVHFYNGQFWYRFAQIQGCYCESDVVLASQVGKQAEGLLWDSQAADTSSLQTLSEENVSVSLAVSTLCEPARDLIGRAAWPQFFGQHKDLNIEAHSDQFCFETIVHLHSYVLKPIQKKLKQMFKQFGRRPDLGQVGQRLYRKFRNMASNWLPNILYCYIIPGLPRHNLELEAIYGKLRQNQRRISGRKVTSPLRLFGAGEVMALMIDSEAELLEWCQTVAQDQETYRTQRRLQEESEERQRWLWRLHRSPARALAQVDLQFYAVLKDLGLLPILQQPDT